MSLFGRYSNIGPPNSEAVVFGTWMALSLRNATIMLNGNHNVATSPEFVCMVPVSKTGAYGMDIVAHGTEDDEPLEMGIMQ